MPSGAKHRLAIFASGGGSNADKICTYFKDHDRISINLILTNQLHAGVLHVAARHSIPSALVPKAEWKSADRVLSLLTDHDITHIVLAGFLLLIPDWLIRKYPHRIVNIHPALLPRHGGKGMYGHHVHQSVKDAGDLITGITIHEIDEHYDRGKILFQSEVHISPTDTPDEIGAKVLKAEHQFYAPVIEKWVTGNPIARSLSRPSDH